jgi:chromosome segregation protein
MLLQNYGEMDDKSKIIALLREFQKESQFIVITHTKRTMSIADVLFGVTMQMQGVSKKISVRFDEYEEEPAAA